VSAAHDIFATDARSRCYATAQSDMTCAKQRKSGAKSSDAMRSAQPTSVMTRCHVLLNRPALMRHSPALTIRATLPMTFALRLMSPAGAKRLLLYAPPRRTILIDFTIRLLRSFAAARRAYTDRSSIDLFFLSTPYADFLRFQAAPRRACHRMLFPRHHDVISQRPAHRHK